MTRNALALMGGLLLALPGCATNGSGSSNMSGSWSASGSSLSPGTVADVHACTQGLSAQRIDDHLQVVALDALGGQDPIRHGPHVVRQPEH